MKKFALFLLIACVAFTVYAGGGQAQGGASASGSGNVQLRMIVNSSTIEMPPTIEYYEKLNPNVDIELELIPAANIFAKYQALMATNTMPDIIWSQSGTYFSLVQNGVLAELTEQFKGQNYEGDAVWIDTFIPELLASCRGLLNALGPEVSSKYWGIPYAMTSIAIVYDKTFFEKNGLKEPTNWNEFAALNEKLKTLGKAPFSMTFDLMDWYPRLFWDQRVRPIMDKEPMAFEKGILTFNSPEVRQGLIDFKAMWDKGWFPPHSITANRDQIAQAFIQGELAQYCITPSTLAYLADNVPADWSLASYPFPSITNLPPRTTGGSSNVYSIPKTSTQFDEALKFIKFLTSKTNFGQEHAGYLSSGLNNVTKDPKFAQLTSGYERAGINGFIPDVYVPINATPELIEAWRSDLLPNYLLGQHSLDYICNEFDRLYKETYLDVRKQ